MKVIPEVERVMCNKFDIYVFINSTGNYIKE